MAGMGRGAKAAALAGTLVVKYGPQAKIAWDNGGKQATAAAAQRALLVAARRKAFTQAETVRDGSVLRVAPEGSTVYVVLSGDAPIAAYPPQERPLAELVEHADLDRRLRPQDRPRFGRRRPDRPGSPGRPGRDAGPGPAELG